MLYEVITRNHTNGHTDLPAFSRMNQDSASRGTIRGRGRAKENSRLVRREASTCHRMECPNGCRAQRYDMCRRMTTVIAGRVIFIGIWKLAGIADDHMVFSSFVDMAVKRPNP